MNACKINHYLLTPLLGVTKHTD